MESLIRLKPWEWDPRCVPIPWREEIYQETLKHPLVVGILPDDGVVRPHPPISRVLHEAVKLLAEDGHEFIDWDDSLHAECIEVMVCSTSHTIS